MAMQIHQQEREIVEDVDAGEGIIEFDGIEQHRFAVEKADVVQVQIAMAAPDEALLAPPLEQTMKASECRADRRPIGRNIMRIERIAGSCGERGFILVDHRRDPCGAAIVSHDFGTAMKPGDSLGDLAHQRKFEPAGAAEILQQRVLLEALRAG
jgi:hypothetical protein